MRDYQTKSNVGALPDTITATRFGSGEFNSIAVELENAVLTSDQTLAAADGTGEVSTQLAMALAIYGAGGAFYHADSGAVNAYVLTPISPKESPPAYFDGFTVIFEPGTPNTTASTVNVNSLGVKDITYSDGNALAGGELSGSCGIKYNLSDDRFELLFSSGSLAAIGPVYVVDSTQTDQGATSANPDTYTLYDIATLVGTSKSATAYMPHNPVAGNQTNFVFDTSLDLSIYPELVIKMDNGSRLTRTTGDEVLTVYNPDNLSIAKLQHITSVDMLRFYRGGIVRPQMWGAAATNDALDDDHDAIQYAINACEDIGQTDGYGQIEFDGQFYNSAQLNIHKAIGVSTIGRSLIDGKGAAANCFVLRSDTGESLDGYAKMKFPTIQQYGGTALLLQGVNLLDIEANVIYDCDRAIVLDTSDGNYTGTGVLKAQIQTVSTCRVAVEMAADSDNCIIQGAEIYINFVTITQYGVLFNANALSPSFDGNKVVFQSADFVTVSSAYLLWSNATQINRFTLRVEGWLGGITGAGSMFILGTFNILRLYMSIADTPAAGDWSRWSLTGARNTIDCGDEPSSLSHIVAQAASGSRASFNSNTPFYINAMPIEFSLTSDLTDGSVRAFYIYSPFTSNTAVLGSTSSYLSNSGCVVDQIVDNSGTVANEIIVYIRNVSGATITSGSSIYFIISVGSK